MIRAVFQVSIRVAIELSNGVHLKCVYKDLLSVLIGNVDSYGLASFLDRSFSKLVDILSQKYKDTHLDTQELSKYISDTFEMYILIIFLNNFLIEILIGG